MLKLIQRRWKVYRRPQYHPNQHVSPFEKLTNSPIIRTLKRGIDKLYKTYLCLGPQLKMLGKQYKKKKIQLDIAFTQNIVEYNKRHTNLDSKQKENGIDYRHGHKITKRYIQYYQMSFNIRNQPILP